MPIYEFACRACGHHFDHLQKLSDPDPTVCPQCHAERLHRMLSAPSFRLAGSGWYETDFKAPGDRRNLAGDAGAPPADGHHEHAAAAPASTADSSAAAKPAPPTPAPAAPAPAGDKAAAAAG